MNFSGVGILNIKGNIGILSIISLITKNQAINVMQNADLTEKKTKHKNLLLHIKMDKENLTFGDTEIEKKKFYCNKILVHLRDVDIKKALGNKISFGEKNYKYFIG